VVTEKEVLYKKISFANKEGVTTLYYPPTWQEYLKPMDDGTPKTMLVRFGQALNPTE
jgi:CRISPR/Cas system-associated protein Csx1